MSTHTLQIGDIVFPVSKNIKDLKGNKLLATDTGGGFIHDLLDTPERYLVHWFGTDCLSRVGIKDLTIDENAYDVFINQNSDEWNEKHKKLELEIERLSQNI
ncbi:MAG: hypothetical protein ACXW2E_01655 [Nitrososphaeraceae archaeon]